METQLIKRDCGDLLQSRYGEGKLICLGLDPTYERLPGSVLCRYDDPDVPDLEKAIAALDFCVRIVDATHDLVAAYKPNTAFFEALGWEGYMTLEVLIRHIRRVAPHVVIVVDAKRGDIGKTNTGSVHYFFDRLKADAITVNPYFGEEALEPFLAREDKMVIVLCRTSNKGAREFQSVPVTPSEGELEALGIDPGRTNIPLYEFVAMRVGKWQFMGKAAVVVGATAPEELEEVRGILPEITILMPGIGAQGGKLELAVEKGLTTVGDGGLFNAGSEGLYASSEADFAEAARRYVLTMDSNIRQLVLAA